MLRDPLDIIHLGRGICKHGSVNPLQHIPLKKIGTSEDIANAVAFLIEDAPYITGEIIAIDGGRSIGW